MDLSKNWVWFHFHAVSHEPKQRKPSINIVLKHVWKMSNVLSHGVSLQKEAFPQPCPAQSQPHIREQTIVLVTWAQCRQVLSSHSSQQSLLQVLPKNPLGFGPSLAQEPFSCSFCCSKAGPREGLGQAGLRAGTHCPVLWSLSSLTSGFNPCMHPWLMDGDPCCHGTEQPIKTRGCSSDGMWNRGKRSKALMDRYRKELALSFHMKQACNQVSLIHTGMPISQRKTIQYVESLLEDAQWYSQVHFSHDLTYLHSSHDITQSPVGFNPSLLGSVANLWGKLSCEGQKLCPHPLHICLGSSSGPGVSKLQMRYVLCNKGSRWASPATPTRAVPLRKPYLQNVPLNKFHEGRLWILALFSR